MTIEKEAAISKNFCEAMSLLKMVQMFANTQDEDGIHDIDNVMPIIIQKMEIIDQLINQ